MNTRYLKTKLIKEFQTVLLFTKQQKKDGNNDKKRKTILPKVKYNTGFSFSQCN